MKTTFLPLFLALAIAAASCSNGRGRDAFSAGSSSSKEASAEAAADSTAGYARESGNAGTASLNDPSRKIIRTADLRCRVADVYAATTQIEHLAAQTGGQISASNLENSADETRTLPYKPDSLRQISSYTTTAHLSVRVPVQALDTVLAGIAAGAVFIDSRSLRLDDVTLRYLGNKLRAESLSANDAAARARSMARRPAEAIRSGEYADSRAETGIDRRLENMQFGESAAYATLTIDLYQPQRMAQAIVPDIARLMRPGAGQQAALAFAGGLDLLGTLFIGLLNIWPLLLLAVLGILVYRRRRSAGKRHAAATRA